MRVLVVGSGGREHALVETLKRDPEVTELFCAGENPGIAAQVRCIPVDLADVEAIADVATDLGLGADDLVVIGPEAPLVLGVADVVRARGIPCFGPSSVAAQLEGSKAFAKVVMAEAGVPTAASRHCHDLREVDAALAEFGAPYVVKDDAIAAGKGVVVTDDVGAARTHAQQCLAHGSSVVIEEFLDGPEVSLFAVTDGTVVYPLLPAQDFKRLGDGDTGPNTGGMGAYAPVILNAPWTTESLTADVVRTVLQPTVDAMRERGTPFIGLLYAGLALTAHGVRVVEFNARFGDPETQAILALLDSPLGELLRAASIGSLGSVPSPRWHAGFAVTVVLAAPGYPTAPVLGGVIEGCEAAAECSGALVRHAGTAWGTDGTLVSSGGRVLSVTGIADDLFRARERAYAALARISLADGQARRDIAEAASRQP